MKDIVEINASNLVSNNYKSYAKYVLETRALPSVEDGLKLVQRRVIYAANQLPMKLSKTAALAGRVMVYHPHGDSTDSIYTMTYPYNSQKIFNIKGNHGGPTWSASAGRYTECYLNEVGRFNYCQFIDYAEYEEGELGIPEPKSLPCLVPYGIIEGSSGMGVGIATNLMPLNLLDMIHCYKKYIKEGVYDPSIVHPDPGYFLIENDKEEVTESVSNSYGKISLLPIINIESSTKISVGKIPTRSIDYLLSKLGWWISEGYVEFTNESTDQIRYTFEIVNDYKGEITLDALIKKVERYTRSNNSYSRCMVDSDKAAIYCGLEYVMKKSLGTLNKAIDKWISSEIDKLKKKLEVYDSLSLCKSNYVFDDLSKKTTDEVIKIIVDLGVREDIAKEIMRKPISYLTKDHDSEADEVRSKLDELNSHNRVDYLISLYDQFEKMISEDYFSKNHAILKSETLERPKIRLKGHQVEVYQGRRPGYFLGSKVYLVGESGWLYIRNYYSKVSTLIDIVDIDEKVVGLCTDQYKYLEVQTVKNKRGVSFEVSSLTKEKYLLKLDDDEVPVLAQGWNDPPACVTDHVVSKISRTRWY